MTTLMPDMKDMPPVKPWSTEEEMLKDGLKLAFGAYEVQRNTELAFAAKINDKTLDKELRELYLLHVWGFADAAKANHKAYRRMKANYIKHYPQYDFSDC